MDCRDDGCQLWLDHVQSVELDDLHRRGEWDWFTDEGRHRDADDFWCELLHGNDDDHGRNTRAWRSGSPLRFHCGHRHRNVQSWRLFRASWINCRRWVCQPRNRDLDRWSNGGHDLLGNHAGRRNFRNAWSFREGRFGNDDSFWRWHVSRIYDDHCWNVEARDKWVGA